MKATCNQAMETVSSLKVFRILGTYDPGWNDPPSMSVNPSITKPRLNLNKRVGFPMGSPSIPGQSPGNLQHPPTNMPPMPPVGMPPMIPAMPPSIPSSTGNQHQEYKDPSIIITPLVEALGKSSELSSKAPDLQKRLEALRSSLTAGQLNMDITNTLEEIALGELSCNEVDISILNFYFLDVRNGKRSDAEEKLRVLILNNGPACIQWSIAIRQIILSLPENSDQIETI